MGKKLISLFLVACVCLISGCGRREELPVAVWSGSYDDGETGEDGSGDPWDESGYETSELSEELSDFRITLEGEEYRFPTSFQAFTARGWSYQGEPERTVNSESYLEGEIFEKDGHAVQVYIWNADMESRNIEDCRIAGVRFDAATPESRDIRAELPAGVLLHQSTERDVVSIYGEAADRYEDEGGVILTYADGAYRSIQLGFDSENGTLKMLDILNIEETGATVPADETFPREPDAYREPDRPGNTLADAVVEFGGDLYRLPAPVKAFEENGWRVSAQESEASVEGGQYGSAILEREGRTFYTVVRNAGENAAPVSECLVTEVSGTLDADSAPVVLAGRITLEMEEKEFLEIVGDEEREEQFCEEENIAVYTFYSNDARLDYTEVTVDRVSGRVCGIKVVCNRDTDLEEQVRGEE